MLLRNLAASQELRNGTRLIVTKLPRNIIEEISIYSDNSQTFSYSQAAYDSICQQHAIQI